MSGSHIRLRGLIIPAFRAPWLDPALMGPPVVWLASRASDGQTDQRIVAKEFAASPPA